MTIARYAVYFCWATFDEPKVVSKTFKMIMRLPKMGALDSYTNLEKKFENVKTKEWDIKPQIGTNVFLY